MIFIIGDILDYNRLLQTISTYQPEIIFHMAAQSLVRQSYLDPVGTYATNVMGSVHLLEAVRETSCAKVLVNVTSDKCYDNQERGFGYQENDPMGGYDPYSSSKGCVELVTSAYRNSYFNPIDYNRHGVAIGSARAGNVVGGGDWSKDRLIPDVIRAILNYQSVIIRKPKAIRPWQHVLEPLNGYLILAQRLWENGPQFSGGWNFGPDDDEQIPVGDVTKKLINLWGSDIECISPEDQQPHEASFLTLNCTKTKTQLGWKPELSLNQTLQLTVDWYKSYADAQNVRELTQMQINQYINLREVAV